MRPTTLNLAIAASTLWMTASGFAQSPKPASRPQGAAEATAADQAVQQQVDALQQHFARQQQILDQQLAQAAKIRQQGLQKNDNKLLEQAEQLERRALQLYLQRIEQLEKASIKVPASQAPAAAAARATQPTPQPKKPAPEQSSFLRQLFGR